MSPHDNKSPCAADALFSVTPLTVNGRTVRILRLCDPLAEVRQLGLLEDAGIRAALIDRAERNNFIPQSLRDAYADALLAHYHAAEKKEAVGSV
jgi:hypothetical protein